jgi:hypothetical protein
MLRLRVAAAAAILGPLVAAGTMFAVGSRHAAYDPIASSVSRLAAVGAPGGDVMNAAIAFLGASILALALVMTRGPGGGAWAAVLVGVAGVSFMAGAIIRIDPSTPATIVAHRAITSVALLALTLAPLASAVWPQRGAGPMYRCISALIGALAVIGLIAAVGLLFDGFPGGVWERAMAALTLGWVELTAARLLRPPAPEPG